MKASLLAIVVMGAAVLPLTACASSESSEAGADQGTRSIYVGANATDSRTVQVPASRENVSEPPYALRGNGNAAAAPHTAVEADASTGRPLQGTNGF